ncbi:redoxin domain-containing protein [Vulcaniibacterium tengchongense]|uniref:AhpC/TSA family protein n=1 Tax=Vulcaniibacterium tengchongense TaxID=1273429 RepID=A0A3N4VBA3_9GAMM|nr:redoxin domain-containing protein [Vulcaniibacterium tengchongense]RPE79888.1 AhpC/TSA family protein [Vulcaniibacterium tengchongense]
MTVLPPPAPEWAVVQWFNTPDPLTLQALRGRAVALLSFQMLCPGCVASALPQAARLHALFPRERLAVVGLHTVFEHHEAMTPAALRAFLHEYRIPFPVGVDRHDGASPLPRTMRAYAMRGTPTWTLIDREGRLRAQHFGEIDDLHLGAEVAALTLGADLRAPRARGDAPGCADGACAAAADG